MLAAAGAKKMHQIHARNRLQQLQIPVSRPKHAQSVLRQSVLRRNEWPSLAVAANGKHPPHSRWCCHETLRPLQVTQPQALAPKAPRAECAAYALLWARQCRRVPVHRRLPQELCIVADIVPYLLDKQLQTCSERFKIVVG